MKILKLVLVSILLCSSILTNVGVASAAVQTPATATATEGTAPTTANGMANTMLEFFKTEKQVNMANVSKDEAMVYGIFISNFYKPYQTTVGDIASESGVSKTISNKFFGSETSTETVRQVNTVIQKSIVDGLSTNPMKAQWGIYSSKGKARESDPMQGKTILTKISGSSGDTKVYNSEGKEWFDLNSKSMLTALKILFAYSPDMFLTEGKGLRQIDELYMDGYGNIWGKPMKVTDVNKFVLILPAVLNPLVFDKKVPMANVFVTGAIMDAEGETFSKKGFTNPYYNYLGHTTSRGILNITGIQSPSSYLGKSDDITGATIKSSETEKIAQKMKEETTNDISVGTRKIMFGFDTYSANNVFKQVGSLGLKSPSNEKKLISVLSQTVMLTPAEVNDTMYFFDTGRNTQAADSESAGTWDSPSNLAMEFKLFDYKKDGKSTFYTNSVTSSGLLYYSSQSKGKVNNLISSYGIDTGGQALYDFITTLKLSNHASVSKALEDAVEKEKGEKVFQSFQANKYVGRVYSGDSGFLSIIPKSFDGWQVAGFGVTKEDSILAQASGIEMDGWLDNVFIGNNNIKAKEPFSIKNTKTTLNLGKSNNANFAELVYLLHVYRLYSTNTVYLQAIQENKTKAGAKLKTTVGEGKIGTDVADGKNNFAGIYWAYLKDLIKITLDEQGNASVQGFSNSLLPQMNLGFTGAGFNTVGLFNADGSGIAGSDAQAEGQSVYDKLLSLVYDIVSPEVNEEKMGFFKSFVVSASLEVHRTLTNSWDGFKSVISSTDANGYTPQLNFIKSPSLEEIPFASKLLSEYVYIYLLLMILVIVFLFFTVLFKIYKFGQAMLMLLLVSFLMITPQYYVGGVSNVNNQFADSLLSDKFVYWALVQQQTVQNTLQQASTTGDVTDVVVAENMEDASIQAAATSPNNNPSGIRIKWMAPKRYDEFNRIFGGNQSDEALLNESGTLFKWLTRSYFYQEEFVYSDKLATYIYKPYRAIVEEAENNYKNFSDSKEGLDKSGYANTIKSHKSSDALFSDTDFLIPSKALEDINKELKFSKEKRNLFRAVDTYTSDESNSVDKLFKHRYWGTSDDIITQAILRTEYEIETAGLEMNEEEYTYQAFTHLTESPYFYFYNVLRSNYAEDGMSFKQALLNKRVFKADTSEFKGELAYSSDAELRDFLDLEGLFTYVVPYLNKANSYVYGWTRKFGTDIPEFDFNTGKLAEGSEMGDLFEEHSLRKDALAKVWTLYAPWVDQLYSSKSVDQIRLTTKDKASVADTLNPSHYAKAGRLMVFSPAEMHAHGLTDSMLSEEEKKMQKVLEKTYEDLMYLNNYRDFSEESLISIAAMLATFNFNEVFSKVSIVGDSSVLYPQNFEVKNFNYDAYMKMIMMEASGETVLSDKDIYQTVLEKTSIFTGIVLIIADIGGIYVVPIMRLVALTLLFLLTMLYTISAVLAKPDRIIPRTVEVLIKPALLYVVFTTLFTYFVYSMLGDNSSNYILSRDSAVSLKDPTMSMLWLVGLCVVYSILLLWLSFKLFKSVIEHFKLILSVVKALTANLTARVSSALSNITSKRVDIRGNSNNKGNINANGDVASKGNLNKGLFNEDETYSPLASRRNRSLTRRQARAEAELLKEWLDDKVDRGSMNETKGVRRGVSKVVEGAGAVVGKVGSLGKGAVVKTAGGVGLVGLAVGTTLKNNTKAGKFITSKVSPSLNKLRDKTGKAVTTGKSKVVNTALMQNLKEIKQKRLNKQLRGAKANNDKRLDAVRNSQSSFAKPKKGFATDNTVEVKTQKVTIRKKKRRKKKGRNKRK